MMRVSILEISALLPLIIRALCLLLLLLHATTLELG